jgi:hypothetical protein
VVVLSKLDLCQGTPPTESFAAAIGRPVLELSAVTGQGVQPLVAQLFALAGSAR